MEIPKSSEEVFLDFVVHHSKEGKKKVGKLIDQGGHSQATPVSH